MASQPPTPREVFGLGPFHSDPELLLGGAGPANDMFSAPMGLPDMGMATDMLAEAAPTQPAEEAVIDKLKPGTDLHNTVREKLDAMQKFSENKMKQHYYRWNWMEMKVQAYLQDADYERLIDEVRAGERAPEPIQVVVPYTYATLHSAATYISTVLMGRKPIFPLAPIRGTTADRARHMEQALQSNMDMSNGSETIWQHIWDSLCYGFSCNRIGWEQHEGPAIKIINGERTTQDQVTFAGNVLAAIDPYKVFPDPRVALHKCPDKGDFIFTLQDVSELTLRDLEKAGGFKWVKEALAGSHGKPRNHNSDSNQPSRRRVRIGGNTSTDELLTPQNVVGWREMFEGTVRLIPKDWGLGESESSELWKFSWFKGGQIMQAEPLGMLHGKHPYVFSEPTSLGYDFMSMSQAEMISTFQDILSWLVSSRMENVRAAIENSFIADPARVEMNDIRSTAIGRVIRLKQSAMGLPIKQAIEQVIVNDVTGGHLTDIQVMRTLADTATGVNDSLRGIDQGSGRRSATEARMTIQAGASRLSQLAVRISSQSFQPMARQMIFNIQQFMPPEMWAEMTGDEGKQLTPEMLIGDFNYQVSDGTLPLDKAALVETWKEILFGIARDPELRQQFDLAGIFEHTAELGGAKDIERFKRQAPMIAPPGVDPEGTPIGPANPAMPSNVF